MSPWRTASLSWVLVVLACSSPRPPLTVLAVGTAAVAESRPVLAPPEPLECAVFADAQIDEVPVSDHFEAPLPTTLEGWGAMRRGTGIHPPQRHMEQRLCGREPAMVERMLTALAGSEERVVQEYGRLLDQCSSRCELGIMVVTANLPKEARSAGWRSLIGCADERTEALFLQGQADAESFLAWYGRRPVGKRTASPALEAALGAFCARQAWSMAQELRPVAESEDPSVARLLLRVLSETRDPERRKVIALAMGPSKNRLLHRAFVDACRSNQRVECEAAAPTNAPDLPRFAQPWSSFTDRAGNLKEGVDREVFLEAMGSCWRDRANRFRVGCLRSVAGVDWGRARVLAIEATGSDGPDDVFAALRAFETRSDLERFLTGLGLKLSNRVAHATTLIEAIDDAVVTNVMSGRPAWDQAEDLWYDLTGSPDNPWGHYLLDASIRAGRDRVDISLVAYGRGKRYEVTPDAIADEFLAHDGSARASSGERLVLRGLMGLMNAIARDEGNPARLVLAAGSDEVQILIVSRDGACALKERGLVL